MKKKLIVFIIIITLLTSVTPVHAKDTKAISKATLSFYNNSERFYDNSVTEKSPTYELIEVSLQFFGSNGNEKYKKQLTQEEKNDLDDLFNKFKSDLENATTLRETIKVYHNMIVSLNDYDLLPKGMRVKSTQRLVTSSLNFVDKIRLSSNKIIVDESKQPSGEIFENYNCLVSGSSIVTGIPRHGQIFRILMNELTGIWIGDIYQGWYSALSQLYDFAKGWINTFSLRKKWNYEGDFIGYIDYIGSFEIGYYIGISGFVGICYDDEYYFGIARHVKIGTALWYP